MNERDIKILPDWEIRIKKTNNGFVASHLEENKDGTYVVEREVFQASRDSLQYEDDIDKDDCDLIPKDEVAMFDLFWHIKEYFGMYWSKHNKYNLVVKFEKNEDIDY